ncbi:MAG: hypothetical protein ACE5DY_07595 [Mariprofundaceae bacterium]
MLFLKDKRGLLSSLLLVLTFMMAGCDGSGANSALPEVGPEAVTKKFYDLITEAKLKGGASPAKEAFKLIDSENANLNIHQFLEIIKRYPPGFMVNVGKVKINGTQAVVAINYKMRSSFGDAFTVEGELPLNVDQETHTWKIDFTGDSYGMQKKEFMALQPKNTQ